MERGAESLESFDDFLNLLIDLTFLLLEDVVDTDLNPPNEVAQTVIDVLLEVLDQFTDEEVV